MTALIPWEPATGLLTPADADEAAVNIFARARVRQSDVPRVEALIRAMAVASTAYADAAIFKMLAEGRKQ